MQSSNSPFDVLRKLAAQTVEVGASRSSANDTAVAVSGIGFSLCGKPMIAKMGEVVEVVKPPKSTFVPGAKPWLLGIANLRGRLLPLIDLEAFIGAKLIGNNSFHRVLVVEVGDVYVGLVVSRVFGLKHFSASQVIDSVDCSNELYEHLVDGACDDNGEQWLRFSIRELVKNEQFNDISFSHISDTSVFARSVA